VGPGAVLDAVVKRKIPCLCRESNPRTPIVQPTAQRYTDRAFMTLIVYLEEVQNVSELRDILVRYYLAGN
jgi:hypothetical protein